MFRNGWLTILRKSSGGCAGLLMLAAVLGASASQGAVRFQSIYQFAGPPDGGEPYTGLVSSKGILYGTTIQGGTDGLGSVFSLKPPAAPGGAWTETVLYTFGGGDDGFNPIGNLAIDRRGAIYGTTSSGGRKHVGIVYELVPPATPDGTWKKRTI